MKAKDERDGLKVRHARSFAATLAPPSPPPLIAPSHLTHPPTPPRPQTQLDALDKELKNCANETNKRFDDKADGLKALIANLAGLFGRLSSNVTTLAATVEQYRDESSAKINEVRDESKASSNELLGFILDLAADNDDRLKGISVARQRGDQAEADARCDRGGLRAVQDHRAPQQDDGESRRGGGADRCAPQGGGRGASGAVRTRRRSPTRTPSST